MTSTAQTTGQDVVEHTGEPPFDVVGDLAIVSTDDRPFLFGTVTASGPWGVEVEHGTLTGPRRQVLAWTAPGRTYLFRRPAQ